MRTNVCVAKFKNEKQNSFIHALLEMPPMKYTKKSSCLHI